MKKRVIGIIIAVLVLLQPMAAFAEANYGNAARESVAYIACYFLGKDGNDVQRSDDIEVKLSHATCFFVGENGADPQYVITNYHVVDQYYKCGAGKLDYYPERSIFGTQPQEEEEYYYYGRCVMRVYLEKDRYIEAYSLAADTINDVAIFRLDEPTSERKPLALCSPTDELVSTKIFAVGYPYLSDNDVAGSTTAYGSKESSVTEGTVSRMFTQEGTGTRTIEIDCNLMAGNSGGPLVSDANGAAIGITTWGLVASSGEQMNYAINIDEAIMLLKRNNVPFYELAAGQAADTNPIAGEDTTGIEETDPVPAGIKTSTIILIAVISVLVIGLIIFAIVFISEKKKKEAAQQQAQNAEVAAANAVRKQPVVRSLAQQHKGVRVNIQDKIITVGRSRSDCAIVFAADTRGVSSKHCTVAWNANTGDFVVVDLQSTYGTYLLNGQKLTPGIAYHLSAGDRFYLGEKDNMLSVDVE